MAQSRCAKIYFFFFLQSHVTVTKIEPVLNQRKSQSIPENQHYTGHIFRPQCKENRNQPEKEI